MVPLAAEVAIGMIFWGNLERDNKKINKYRRSSLNITVDSFI